MPEQNPKSSMSDKMILRIVYDIISYLFEGLR